MRFIYLLVVMLFVVCGSIRCGQTLKRALPPPPLPHELVSVTQPMPVMQSISSSFMAASHDSCFIYYHEKELKLNTNNIRIEVYTEREDSVLIEPLSVRGFIILPPMRKNVKKIKIGSLILNPCEHLTSEN